MVAPGHDIQQELFVAKAADGSELKLVRLVDGRCAICHGGEVVRTGGFGESDVDAMVGEFLAMIDAV
ncbi:MAG TPA: hypothetical protein VF669_04800 [Tepidisphaeraceae bacterium]